MQPDKLKSTALMFITGMLLLHLVLFWRDRHFIFAGYPDFTIFYTAGKMVRQGLGHQLYNAAEQYRVQLEFAPGVYIRQGPLPFNHVPFEALLFVPLAYFSYPVAFVLWDLINLLVLIRLRSPLLPFVPVLHYMSWPLWLLTNLAFFPVFIHFLQGQDTLPVLLLYVLAYAALKGKRDLAAGAWLGLGVFKLHLVLPFVLLLLLQRRTRFLAGFAIVSVALALVSLAVVGEQQFLTYPRYVWHVEQSMTRAGVVPVAMPNLRGLLNNLSGWIGPSFAKVLAGAASFALLLDTARRWRASMDSKLFDLGFSLGIVATLLVSFHTFAYDLSLLILPIAVLANHLRETGRLFNMRDPLVLPILALFFSPLYALLALRWTMFNLVACVLLWLMWAIWREMGSYSAAPPVSSALPEG